MLIAMVCWKRETVRCENNTTLHTKKRSTTIRLSVFSSRKGNGEESKRTGLNPEYLPVFLQLCLWNVLLAPQKYPVHNWCGVSIRNKVNRRNRLRDVKIRNLSLRDRTVILAQSHGIRTVHGTMNSAYAMGLSKDYGSITKGKVANFYITKPIPSVDFIPYAYTTPIVDRIFLRGEEYIPQTEL